MPEQTEIYKGPILLTLPHKILVKPAFFLAKKAHGLSNQHFLWPTLVIGGVGKLP